MTDGLKRRAARFFLRLRFHLWQRRRHNRLALEKVDGHDLVVLPGVMNPALFRTGAFLARSLNDTLIPPGSRVLDMGTGSGIGAIAAARWAQEVDAVDVSPAAVRCAQINALLNDVEERVNVCQGDLFASLGNKPYDVVLFNPPFYRGSPQNSFDFAWRAEDTVERFAAGLRDHLKPGGYALVLLSTDGDSPAFLRCFAQEGFGQSVVARRDLTTEILTVFRFTAER